jgi:hypothetical protein
MDELASAIDRIITGPGTVPVTNLASGKAQISGGSSDRSGARPTDRLTTGLRDCS